MTSFKVQEGENDDTMLEKNVSLILIAIILRLNLKNEIRISQICPHQYVWACLLVETEDFNKKCFDGRKTSFFQDRL